MLGQALAGCPHAGSLAKYATWRSIPTAPSLPAPHSMRRRSVSLQATAPEQPEQQRSTSKPAGSRRRTKLRIRRRRERPSRNGYDPQADLEELQHLLGELNLGLNARDINTVEALTNDVLAQRMDDMLQGMTPEELLRMRQQYGEAVDTAEFWESAVFNGFMWEVLRERLGPEDSALVTKLFGDNWDSMADIDDEWIQNQVGSLDDNDRIRLFSVLSKLSTIQAQIAELAQGQQTAANMAEQLVQQQEEYMQQQQRARQWPAEASGRAIEEVEVLQDGQTVIVGSGSGIDPQDPSASRPWGQWGAAAPSNARNNSTSTSNSSGTSSSGGSADSWTSSSFGTGNGSAGDSYSRADSSSGASSSGSGMFDADTLAEHVNSFTRHWEAMNSGQQQWGPPMSRHFDTLKTIQTRLFDLESLDTDNLQQYDMTPDDFMAAYDYVNEQMAALLSEVDSIRDNGTRSVLIYMETLAGEGDRQPDEPSQLEVSLDSLRQLGTFMNAAENLEALKAWTHAYAASNPTLQLEELLELSGLDANDWFILPDQRVEAAMAFNEVSATGRGGGPLLRRFIDQQRIEVLSSLDSNLLHFMAELEGTQYSQDTLIKWSLHPKVGPKLMTGEWVRERQLPEALQLLYKLAMQPGEDYDFGVEPS